MKQFFFDKNVRMAFAGLSCMALLGLPQSAVAQDMTVYPYAEDYQVITVMERGVGFPILVLFMWMIRCLAVL